MQRPLFVFRGSPAAGKGTLVPEFCKTLPPPVALLEHDTFRWGFHKMHRAYAEVSAEEHVFAFGNMLQTLERYLKRDAYSVVAEGLFTWDDREASQGNMQQIVEVAARCGAACVSVVLQADRQELEHRNSLRPYAVPDDEFDMLYTNVYKHIGPEEIVIDTTGQTVDGSIERMHELGRSLGRLPA